jgi:hypothetical protein
MLFRQPAAECVLGAFVNYLLAVRDLVMFCLRERQAEFEHAGQVGMAIIKRRRIQRPAVAEAHDGASRSRR